MANLLQFPADRAARAGFEPVKATYTAREISRQFGLPEHLIRRWTREGLIPTVSGPEEARYDFRALKQFRRLRELRARGVSLQTISRELRGQLNLFPEAPADLIRLPVRLSTFEEALLLFDAGDPGAAELFRRAIQESDCVADAYCNLGILESDAGRLNQAFDCLTNALAEDPRHFESHYNLANLYFEMGDYRLSRQHYELAGTLEPNFPNLYFNLGLVHALSGDLKAAVVALEQYKTLIADDEAAQEEAARATELISRFESALALVR